MSDKEDDKNNKNQFDDIHKKLEQQREDEEYEEDGDTPIPDSQENDHSTKISESKRAYVTYENQRWWLSTWTSTLLPGGKQDFLDFQLIQSKYRAL
jgi:hypothetical protein